MRFITPQVHKVLDYVTIVAFALSPTVVGLAGLAATIAYALAVVHLAVTVGTRFPGAAPRPLSFRAHGALEAVVGVVLLLLPFVLGWTGRARVFYLAAGVVILIVSFVSSYGVEQPSVGAAP